MVTFSKGDKLTYTYLRQMLDEGMQAVEVANVIQTIDGDGVSVHYALQSLETGEVKVYPTGFVTNAYKKAD